MRPAQAAVPDRLALRSSVDLQAFWPVVRRYARLLIVLALVGGIIGVELEVTKPTSYVGQIRVFANGKKADSTPVSQATSLAVARMETYVQLVDSTRLASRLISRLRLTDSPAQLASEISATLDKETVVMTIKVRAPSAAEAGRIVAVIPDELTLLVNQLVDVPISDPRATVFTGFDGPFVRKALSLTRLVMSAVIGMVLGVGLGLAGALAWQRRRSAHSPEALATAVGLPVVGIIPRQDRNVADRTWLGGLQESQRLACHRMARALPHLTHGDRFLVVVSGADENVDSTTVAIGLAGALSQRGQRVVILDAGFGATGVAERLLAEFGRELPSVPADRMSNGTAAKRAEANEPWFPSSEETLPLEIARIAQQIEVAQRRLSEPIGVDTSGSSADTAINGSGGDASLVQRKGGLAGTATSIIGPPQPPYLYAVETVPGFAGLDVASVGTSSEGVVGWEQRRRLAAFVAQLREQYDAVVVDAAPVLARSDLPTMVETADAVLLVVDQFSTSRPETMAATDTLKAMTAARCGLVINRTRTSTMRQDRFLAGVVLPPLGAADAT